ncbi:MAG: enolase C-terminal domain-like protein, partial [Pseudomonadota bacterium]
GLSEILRIASMAQDLDITIHPHTSVTRVNMAASLHLLCALSNGGYFEADYSAFNPFRTELTSGGYVQHPDASFAPLDSPGLGVTIDESALSRFTVIPGPGYV